MYCQLTVKEDKIYNLWGCLSEPLVRAAMDNGLDAGVTTEVEFLEGIRKLAVKAQNSLVARVKFLNTGQDRDKKVNNYVSRLRGAAIGCQFEVKCPSCQGTVS